MTEENKVVGATQVSAKEISRIIEILQSDHPQLRDPEKAAEVQILLQRDISRVVRSKKHMTDGDASAHVATILALLASSASSAGLFAAVTVPTIPILALASAVVGLGGAGWVIAESIKKKNRSKS